ncbi:PE1 protein, partial [Pseudoatta argentina]
FNIGICLLTIAFLASWTIITASKLPIIFETEECPVSNISPLSKLIFHETDCTKYYECKNGQKQLRFCKVGLYFSKRWFGCVTPEISECSPLTSTCPTTDDCPPKLIPIKQDCTKYYECKNSKKELRFCKAGLYFSQYWQGCTPIPTTQTPIPTTQTPIPTTPIPTPTTPHRCINGDLLEHECTCTKYYLCIEGYKALLECPPGKYFDISTKTCQPGTGCLQVIPSPISNPITSQCTESEYIPHEYECKKYYECKVDRKILRECNDGMIFNKALQTCVLGQC